MLFNGDIVMHVNIGNCWVDRKNKFIEGEMYSGWYS